MGGALEAAGGGGGGMRNLVVGAGDLLPPLARPHPLSRPPPFQISAAKRNLEDSSALAELEVASLRTQVCVGGSPR